MTTRLLRAAARRWPEELREQMLREWSAELDAIDGRGLERRWRRLRYAMSLGMSPAVEEAGAAPRTWHEALPSVGRAAADLFLVGCVAVAAAFAGALAQLGQNLVSQVPRDAPATSFDWLANTISVVALAVAVVAMIAVGRVVGRSTPLVWAPGTRIAAVGHAVVATTIVATSSWFVLWLQGFETGSSGGTRLYVLDSLASLVAWSVCVSVTAVVVVRLANARRRFAAVSVALLGGLATLEISTVVAVLRSSADIGVGKVTAPLWFPLSLLDLENSGVRFGNIDQGYVASQTVAQAAADLSRPLLALTGFVVAYAIHASRARAIVPSTAPSEPAQVPGWVAAASTAVSGVGAAVWAYAVAFLTPQAYAADVVGSLHLWAQEIREYAILLVVLGFAARLAGRVPVSVASIFAYGGLLAVDSALASTGTKGVPAAWCAVLAAGAVVGGGWLLVRQFSGTGDVSARRAHGVIAVIAALAAPGLFITITPDALPTAMVSTEYTVMGLLWVTACTAAWATRRQPLPRALAALASFGPAALVTVFLTAVAEPWSQFAVASGALCVVAVLCVVSWNASSRPSSWVMLALVSLPLGVGLIFAQLALALLLGPSLMAASGYGFPADGLPFQPGTAAIGLALGVLFSRRIGRRPPSDEPALDDPVPVGGPVPSH